MGTDPVLRFLVDEGMRGRASFAEDYGWKESPDGYLSKCAQGLDIRKYLVSREDFDEHNPKEFYNHLD